MASEAELGRAAEILRRSPLVDGHNDLPWAMRLLAGYDMDRVDPSSRLTRTHTDLVRLREGRVGAQFWSVYVPSNLPGDTAVTATLEQIDFVHQMLARCPETLGLACSADEIEDVFAGGRIASLLGAEGGQSIGNSLGALRALYALGVRYMTLTHNDNNDWADSATDESRLGGLSDFGREVVREMNRLGMLVDLSHVSPGTMSDALDVSEAPVIFSHSSCRALVDHVRNVPDEVLARLGSNGGVCMVTFVPDFVSRPCFEWSLGLGQAMRDEGLDPKDWTARLSFAGRFAEVHPRPRASIAEVAQHIEHVREVVGVEAVGIGGDYDGCDAMPDGLDDVTGYPRLLAELLERGWSETDCARLAGGDVVRALREAEAVADKAARTRPPSTLRFAR
jgi:membrane dipeptidase